MDTSKIPINVDKAEFLTTLRKNKEEAFKYMYSKVFFCSNVLFPDSLGNSY